MSDPIPELIPPAILNIKSVATSTIFHIEQVTLRFSNGEIREFERLKVWEPGVVMIIPLLTPVTVLLVKEYAAGVNDYTLSLPKGRIEKNEEIRVAANRELQEEVGYAATKFTYLSAVTTAPSYSSTLTHFVLAEELTPSRLPADEPEPLVVVPWQLTEMSSLLSRADFHEARAIAALYLTIDHLKGRK